MFQDKSMLSSLQDEFNRMKENSPNLVPVVTAFSLTGSNPDTKLLEEKTEMIEKTQRLLEENQKIIQEKDLKIENERKRTDQVTNK